MNSATTMHDWLTRHCGQPFELDGDANLRFTALGETLEQQIARPYITALPALGRLNVSGADAKTFLQGQLTCDLNAVSLEQCAAGLHCSPQGRVIANFQLCQTAATEYALLLPATMADTLQHSLGKYIVFSKAAINRDDAGAVMLGISGASAGPTVERYFGSVAQRPWQQISGHGGFCFQAADNPERYLVCLPPAEAADFWQRASAAMAPADSSAWALQDIRHGLVNIAAKTSGAFIPQMLGYDRLGAISFNKGCYTGQEVVARAHYRGAVKRKPHRLSCRTSRALSAGDPLYHGARQVGIIVAAVAAEPGVQQGLAVLSEQPDTALYLEPGPDGARCEVAPLEPTTNSA